MTSLALHDHESYTTEFFDKMTEQALSSARVIIPLVLERVEANSAIDLGCGRGTWLKVLQESGVERVFGADGPWVNPEDLLIDQSSFVTADLRQTIPVEERFDLAVCLEVAEHLPKACSAALVRQLTSLAPVVLFSAAIPGQGGTDHVNEQWPEFWNELFRRHEFTRLDCIRPRIWQDARVAWFYQQNIYLFVRDDVVTASKALQDDLERSNSGGLTLVHPKVMKPLWSPRLSLRQLPGLLKAAIMRRLGKQV